MGAHHDKNQASLINYHDKYLPIEGYANLPILPLELAVEPLMHILPSIQIYVGKAKSKCLNPAHGLTSDQSASIMLCTMRWQPLDQCLSFVLNTTLRSTDREKLKPWLSYLKLLLTSLDHLPSFHRTIYRGIQSDVSAQYSKDRSIIWWDFTLCSTTIDQLYSKKYLNRKDTRTIFTIECYSSKDISKHTFDSSQDFILLLPATQLQVIRCLKQKPNIHWIRLSEIRSPFFLLQSVSIMTDLSHGLIPPSAMKECSLPNEYKHQRRLEQCLAKYPSHAPIQLRFEQISNREMKIIVQQALTEKQCTELWLYNARITAQAALILSHGLFNNTSLMKLYLNHNSIHDRGVHSLCRALMINNTTLKELHLARNGITSQGAKYLSDMLKSNRTLITLNLYGNRIDDQGMKYLTEVLTSFNGSLEHLYLSGNNLMTDLSIEYLLMMFKENQTLKKIHLFNCNFSEEGKEKLREMLERKDYLILNV